MKKFTGITVSKGKVKARTLVVEDLTKLPIVPDYEFIVIAPYTTPIMNVILLSAKGIVCETGGMTTHASIIARELKIPCVVSVKNIISHIKNGQEVELNADIGEVTIL